MSCDSSIVKNSMKLYTFRDYSININFKSLSKCRNAKTVKKFVAKISIVLLIFHSFVIFFLGGGAIQVFNSVSGDEIYFARNPYVRRHVCYPTASEASREVANLT